jgi:hypothetical protein
MLVAVGVLLTPQAVLVALVAVVLVVLVEALQALLVLPILAVERAVLMEAQEFQRLAVPALSSFLTPYQKAKPLNFYLLQHGQHQQASQPLITW